MWRLMSVLPNPSVLNADGDLRWDGIEIRLLRLLSERLNFTIDVREAADDDSNP